MSKYIDAERLNKEINKMCYKCKYSTYDNQSDGCFVCNNDCSANFSMWVEYDDECEKFEELGGESHNE